MTVEITDIGNSVELRYIADNGGEATATVVGESATDVKNRSQEIVDVHNLDAKAKENGQ